MNRAGIVLVLALVALLALALAGTAAVYAAGHASLVATARVNALRARLAAEAAARAGAARWNDSLRALAPGQSVAVGDARIRRLSPGLFLATAEARDHGAVARAGFLVRVLELRESLVLFPAAVAGASVRIGAGATADAGAAAAAPPGWDDTRCPPGLADTLAAVFGAVGLPGAEAPSALALDVAGRADGEPPTAVAPALADTLPGLGPLSWGRLASLADRVEGGSVRIGPVLDGVACATGAAGNWGDPTHPAAPCADHFPLVVAPGDLQLLGGAGQGVLVVEGDLVVSGDTRFDGAVLAAGDVILRDSATVHGAVRSAGTITLDDEAEVDYSACALARVLLEAPALDRPFRPRGRWRVPVF